MAYIYAKIYALAKYDAEFFSPDFSTLKNFCLRSSPMFHLLLICWT